MQQERKLVEIERIISISNIYIEGYSEDISRFKNLIDIFIIAVMSKWRVLPYGVSCPVSADICLQVEL